MLASLPCFTFLKGPLPSVLARTAGNATGETRGWALNHPLQLLCTSPVKLESHVPPVPTASSFSSRLLSVLNYILGISLEPGISMVPENTVEEVNLGLKVPTLVPISHSFILEERT